MRFYLCRTCTDSFGLIYAFSFAWQNSELEILQSFRDHRSISLCLQAGCDFLFKSKEEAKFRLNTPIKVFFFHITALGGNFQT